MNSQIPGGVIPVSDLTAALCSILGDTNHVLQTAVETRDLDTEWERLNAEENDHA